ncbi:SAM-dependent methyltransferase [Akkermansiaceae bacterium]|nr:SAM-dependent methyltransferase [Akkermansiaceae bacterium]
MSSNSSRRFDQFMSEALYGPRGYYTSPKTILGARGDFTTTPKFNNALACAIAGWLKQEWKRQEKNLPVIELGPGDGTLGKGIHQELGFFGRRRLDYHFVEISPHLRERQKKSLGGKGSWHSTLTEAFEKAGTEALIISNEFFDAFPVRIFRQETEGFSELHLDQKSRESWQPVFDLPDSTLFERNWKEGQRLEIPESVNQWMQDELSLLTSGSILTIDYGSTAAEVYHRRPQGTLRAYAHHQHLIPPEAYLNEGRQDLTYDVNFDDLIDWGAKIGLERRSLRNQAELITEFGNGSRSSHLEEAYQSFQVLIQERH